MEFMKSFIFLVAFIVIAAFHKVHKNGEDQ